MRGKLAHDDLTRYNAAQRAAYLGAIVIITVLVLSGLVIWKPVQFQLVHVLMVLLVPRTLPSMFTGQVSQITRHICVEGWSAIGKWSGVRFSDFLQRIGADTTAKYVGLRCADDYSTSIDMPTALHPQTQLTLRFADQILPAEYGFPMKVRMPTKLGFKNPKHVAALFVTNDYPGGYWEDQGYNWYSGC